METDLAAAALQAEADLADSVAPLFAETPCTMDHYCERYRPPLARFIDIAAGRRHTCGLLADGRVRCWGGSSFFGYDYANHYTDDTSDHFTGTASSWAASNFVRIDAQGGLTCGLRTDASLFCWTGEGSFPRGHPLSWEQPRPYESGSYTDFAATDSHACALDLDGRFVEVSASDRYTCGHRVDGSVQCWDAWNDAHFHASTERFSSVTTASTYACGRAASAFASCWTFHPELPVPDEAAAGGFTQLSDSGHHTCVLAPDGAVDCWGRNDSGEATPPAGRSYAQISAGGLEGHAGGDIHYHAHTCGVGKDGALDCWGDDRFGQSTPPAGGDFVKVAASGIHACALRTDGEIVCWGWGYGDGRAPPASHDYSDVVVGAGGGFWFPYETDDGEIVHSAHTCGLRLDGIVDCWGTTYSPNKPYNRYEPDSRSRFTSISSGRSHVCGVRTDGAIECWGIPAFIAY